jgi:hypothetical protein
MIVAGKVLQKESCWLGDVEMSVLNIRVELGTCPFTTKFLNLNLKLEGLDRQYLAANEQVQILLRDYAE